MCFRLKPNKTGVVVREGWFITPHQAGLKKLTTKELISKQLGLE